MPAASHLFVENYGKGLTNCFCRKICLLL